MLDTVQALGLSHGISWVSDGCAFAIHDPNVYMTEIAPRFFHKQTHLRSFHRQLSIWGFTRLETGAGGRGVWFHKYFIRSKPELIVRIKRVPVKQNSPTKSSSDDMLEMSSNPTMDYNDYQLPNSGKIARAIGISSGDLDVPKDGMLSQPNKSKRPTLPLRKQRSSPSSNADEKKPSAGAAEAAAAAAAAARSAAMMRSTQAPFAASMHHPTSLQRLYALQEPSMPLGGSPTASSLPPFILTSYGSMAGNPNYPHGSLMTGPSNFRQLMPSLAPSTSAAASSFANPSQMEDVLVARQLAAMGRGPGIPSAAPVGPSQPHFSHDATFMARAMVAESERRRQQQQAAVMQAQAAHVAQAQAMNIRFPPSQQPGNEMGGSDSDILAAIQQRQRFLSQLESEFKAKMAGRGGGGGGM